MLRAKTRNPSTKGNNRKERRDRKEGEGSLCSLRSLRLNMFVLATTPHAFEAGFGHFGVNLHVRFFRARASVSVTRAVEIGFAGEFFRQRKRQREQRHCAERFGLCEHVIRQPCRGSLAQVGGFFASEQEKPFADAD